jgi:hypothetical protein
MKEGSVMKGCIVSAESLPNRPAPPAPNNMPKQEREVCNTCKRLLDDPKDPTTESCGGDCLRCMAWLGEDPDDIIAILNIRIEAQAAEIERLQERNAELHGQLMRMIDRWEQQRAALEARGLEIREKE